MKDIIDFYKTTKSIRKTAKHFKKDPKTIRKILCQNNIEIINHSLGKDLRNQRFGRLVAIEKSKNKIKGRCFRWICICDCGENCEIESHYLISNKKIECNNCSIKTAAKKISNGFKGIKGKYFQSLKKGAKDRKLEFSITIEQIYDLFMLQDGKCALSGLTIKLSDIGTSEEQTASLDRIDSNKGYVKENVQWVHKKINRMKLNISQDDFIELCKLIANNKGKQ